VGICRLHLQSRRISQSRNQHEAGSQQKSRLTFKGLQGAISQKIELFITTNGNLKFCLLTIGIGDFNIELKKKENETLVINMEETFGLKSRIDMVFARNVDNLKCANYIT
jgi:hypothetical protein